MARWCHSVCHKLGAVPLSTPQNPNNLSSIPPKTRNDLWHALLCTFSTRVTSSHQNQSALHLRRPAMALPPACPCCPGTAPAESLASHTHTHNEADAPHSALRRRGHSQTGLFKMSLHSLRLTWKLPELCEWNQVFQRSPGSFHVSLGEGILIWWASTRLRISELSPKSTPSA